MGAHEAALSWPRCDSVQRAPETTAALLLGSLCGCATFFRLGSGSGFKGFTRVSPGSLASPRSEIRHHCLVVEEADAVHGHGHAVAPRAGQHGLVLHRAAGLDDELDAELGGDVHVVREGEERVRGERHAR